MDYKEIKQFCEEYFQNNRIMQFDIFENCQLNDKEVLELAEKFASKGFLKIPEREERFFEWLKQNDEPVWRDLWGAESEEPYIVSFSFLPLLMDKSRGFPICDLIDCENYYFTEDCIITEEGKAFRDSAQERFLSGYKLTAAQALVVELCAFPIDIWRFAYRYGFKVDFAKNIVDELMKDKALAHLKKREEIADLIKFHNVKIEENA